MRSCVLAPVNLKTKRLESYRKYQFGYCHSLPHPWIGNASDAPAGQCCVVFLPHLANQNQFAIEIKRGQESINWLRNQWPFIKSQWDSHTLLPPDGIEDHTVDRFSDYETFKVLHQGFEYPPFSHMPFVAILSSQLRTISLFFISLRQKRDWKGDTNS